MAKRWLRRCLGVFLGLVLFAVVGILSLAAVGDAYAAAPLPDGRDSPLSDKRAKAARASMTTRAATRPLRRGRHLPQQGPRDERTGKPLRTAVCSTGSGLVLRDPRNGREWIFDTPTGERTVQRKVKDPIWAKPDWAFVEEGYAPPPSGSPDRFDDFSLGKYGLYLGDGYIIHGTIFQSLLGRRVTHGCIRLGDDDLEYVYKTVPVGARVYLY